MSLTRETARERELTSAELRMLEETALAVAQATIQNAINDASLTRADMVRRMGRSRSYVTKILQGDHNLTVKTLARAVGACGQQLQLDATEPQCEWAVVERLAFPVGMAMEGAGEQPAPALQWVIAA